MCRDRMHRTRGRHVKAWEMGEEFIRERSAMTCQCTTIHKPRNVIARTAHPLIISVSHMLLPCSFGHSLSSVTLLFLFLLYIFSFSNILSFFMGEFGSVFWNWIFWKSGIFKKCGMKLGFLKKLSVW